MYLFVFLWVPALQEYAASYPAQPLPLGYIFSSFMISMMLGSLLYTAISSYHASQTRPGDSSLTLHAKLSSLVCAVSAAALACSISSRSEHVRFLRFACLRRVWGCITPYRVCCEGHLSRMNIGRPYVLSFPFPSSLAQHSYCSSFLQLSSLFRVPLNVFVVVSLLTGVSSARYAVLTASSIMLVFSSLMTGAVIVRRSDEQQQQANGGHREWEWEWSPMK
jgi:hypothetical protein